MGRANRSLRGHRRRVPIELAGGQMDGGSRGEEAQRVRLPSTRNAPGGVLSRESPPKRFEERRVKLLRTRRRRSRWNLELEQGTLPLESAGDVA